MVPKHLKIKAKKDKKTEMEKGDEGEHEILLEDMQHIVTHYF